MNSQKTLKSILSIISKDVRLIRKANRNCQLSTETALTLSRYASTLNGITLEEKKKRAAVKKNLERKTTDELVSQFLEQKKKQEKQS